MNNLRIKIITIAFAALYCYILGEYLVADIAPAFMAGFKEGYESQQNREADERADSRLDGMIAFQVKTMKYDTYPTLLKTMNNVPLHVHTDRFYARVENPVRPLWIKIARGFSWVFSFALVITLIFIPVQVGKVIHSVLKNEIFDMKNVRRLRRTGYALLLVFLFATAFGVIYTLDARNLVQLADYRIIFSMKEDYIYLLFGLSTLLFAEILKLSHTMKEEQELTI
ncbi:MAG: DUF2975 domain-containing protein [Dysgonamonadaceae bacterium]|jgi:hypothetical protein|nr:DUF2975 domain-containing protein [Dysgonamonadaceae bacterium]